MSIKMCWIFVQLAIASAMCDQTPFFRYRETAPVTQFLRQVLPRTACVPYLCAWLGGTRSG